MHDELAFDAEALREWQTLSAGIREQFKKKLAERLIEPRIPASKLRESSHRDNINRRTAGLRLVYALRDREVLVLVVALECESAMLTTARPISADALRLTPYPLSWISDAGRTHA